MDAERRRSGPGRDADRDGRRSRSAPPISAARSSSSISIPRTTRRAAPARRRISPRSPPSSRRPGPGSSASPRTARRSHAKFTGKYELKVKLATDTDGSVCEAFGTWGEKSLYGRKYMGIDRATFLIDRDGTVARVWRKVKVPGHAEEVLAAARELP